MNSLAQKYGDKIAILQFPCNQFGHQMPGTSEEIMNTLKYARPGNGFEVDPTITMFEKIEVNGADAHPLYKWLRHGIMMPNDEAELVDSRDQGMLDAEKLMTQREADGYNTIALWTPVSRTDVAWNFEKFVIDPTGKLVKRYSQYYDTNLLSEDIDAMLGIVDRKKPVTMRRMEATFGTDSLGGDRC